MTRAWKHKAAAAVLAISTATLGAVTTGGSVQAQPAAQSGSPQQTGIYIVRMLEAPVAAYTGTTPGYAATKPKAGQKIDPASAKVVKYAAHLDESHGLALGHVGGHKLYDYRYSFNGFAAELTQAAALKLASVPGVVSVSKDEIRHLDTANTPKFLGLDVPGGIWSQLGGPNGDKKLAGAGDGIVVGVIDTGIWPESLSFSDRDAAGKLVFQQLPGWHGKCTPGEEFAATKCNQKLIGAQWFNAGFGGDAQVKADYPWEFASARDADSHGSHTASTAAGNYNVPVNVPVADSVLTSVSGMAPRARVAAYKVCWGGDEGGCANSDSVAAIDQAVADGVDVLNYSIGGTPSSSLDPVEIAFMFAADAGVFVAASAGNSGPTASTADHISPWLTTVAASTHNRVATGGGSLGDGTPLNGASIAKATVSGPLVYSTTVKLAAAADADAALCIAGTLDPAKVAGRIVVCERGVIARVDKSAEVQRAGGVGMILVNVVPSSLNADDHVIPTVHVDESYLQKLRDYTATPGASATIIKATVDFNGTAPAMAVFSSRGPALVAGGDVLKPDITAPGVDILAAVSPYASGGKEYDFLSGTSMSSPHMAGIAALMKQRFPGWSPMMIKSALMTSAYQLDSAGNPFGDAFDYGAGHVAPNAATNPGLVYDSGLVEWLGFLCGGELGSGFCDSNGLPTIDPSDLNQASIAIGSLAGTQTVTRRVTNVGGSSATYTATVEAVPGIHVAVSPSTLTLAKGETKSFTVTFTTTASATLDTYSTGALRWTDGSHVVRSPIVVKPVAVAAPDEVLTTGDTSYEIGFGFDGVFSATARGLVPAAATAGTVVDDPANDFGTALATGVGYTAHDIEVPAGTTLARFSLFDDFTSGNDDLDLYVFGPGGFFAGSGSGTSAEQVDVVDPAAGTYTVVVHGWQTDGGQPATYTLFSWALDASDAGNMAVTAPGTGTIGGSGTVSLAFTGLTPGVKYLGAVDYMLAGSSGGSTVIRVDA